MTDDLVWQGYRVVLDGDTVRFGDGKYDWVKPRPPGDLPQPLLGASVSKDGKLLTVAAEDHEFVFYAVSERARVTVFSHRARKRAKQPYGRYPPVAAADELAYLAG